MEIVSLIAPVDLVIAMDVILPCLMRLSPLPGLLDQSSLEEGDVVLSSGSKTERSRVVLRTTVDEKEEAEEDEELHPCSTVCKVIRRRAAWSFILNFGCRHQTVPSVTRSNQECVGIFGQPSHKTRPTKFSFICKFCT